MPLPAAAAGAAAGANAAGAAKGAAGAKALAGGQAAGGAGTAPAGGAGTAPAGGAGTAPGSGARPGGGGGGGKGPGGRGPGRTGRPPRPGSRGRQREGKDQHQPGQGSGNLPNARQGLQQGRGNQFVQGPQQAQAAAVQPAAGKSSGDDNKRLLLVLPALALLLLLLLVIVPILSVISLLQGQSSDGIDVSAIPAAARPFAPMYLDAGKVYQVNPFVLMAIHERETAFGTSNAAGVHDGVNFAGCCAGPMQFFVGGGASNKIGGRGATWAAGITAGGRRLQVRDAYRSATLARPAKYPNQYAPHPNVYDAYDSIYAAAAYLSSMGVGPELDSRTFKGLLHYGGVPPASAVYASAVFSRAKALENRAGGPGLTWTLGGFGSGNNAIVKAAHAQIGQLEWGSNCNHYGPCSAPDEGWCGYFLAWAWGEGGVPGIDVKDTRPFGLAAQMYTWAPAHGGRRLPPSARPAPGDAIFYGYGPGTIKHVGLVESVDARGRITTIEGNVRNQVWHYKEPFSPQTQNPHRPWSVVGYAEPPKPKGASR